MSSKGYKPIKSIHDMTPKETEDLYHKVSLISLDRAFQFHGNSQDALNDPANIIHTAKIFRDFLLKKPQKSV